MRAASHRIVALPLGLFLSACASPAADWQVEVALEAGEKLCGCAAGHLLPDHPGQELVAGSLGG